MVSTIIRVRMLLSQVWKKRVSLWLAHSCLQGGGSFFLLGLHDSRMTRCIVGRSNCKGIHYQVTRIGIVFRHYEAGECANYSFPPTVHSVASFTHAHSDTSLNVTRFFLCHMLRSRSNAWSQRKSTNCSTGYVYVVFYQCFYQEILKFNRIALWHLTIVSQNRTYLHKCVYIIHYERNGFIYV